MGDTSLSVINSFEKGQGQGHGSDLLNCVNRISGMDEDKRSNNSNIV